MENFFFGVAGISSLVTDGERLVRRVVCGTGVDTRAVSLLCEFRRVSRFAVLRVTGESLCKATFSSVRVELRRDRVRYGLIVRGVSTRSTLLATDDFRDDGGELFSLFSIAN